jgi:hypothetical protein
MNADDPSTEELRTVQAQRERDERERAEQAEQTGEIPAVRAHEARADRAAYLREKLEEQAESERE